MGIAVTDPMRIICSPLETVPAQEIYTYLQAYLAREPVRTIVVGWAANDDGSATDSTLMIQNFIKSLKKKYKDQEIVTEDESYSSQQALQTMIDMNTTKKQRRIKENIDKISAAIILQRYVNRLNLPAL